MTTALPIRWQRGSFGGEGRVGGLRVVAPHDVQLDAFVNAIREGLAPLMSGSDTMASISVLDAMVAAAFGARIRSGVEVMAAVPAYCAARWVSRRR